MRIVGKAVEQDDRKAGRIAALVIADFQDACPNRLDRWHRRRLRAEAFERGRGKEARRALDEESAIHETLRRLGATCP
jgi:hypothetical protein